MNKPKQKGFEILDDLVSYYLTRFTFPYLAFNSSIHPSIHPRPIRPISFLLGNIILVRLIRDSMLFGFRSSYLIAFAVFTNSRILSRLC